MKKIGMIKSEKAVSEVLGMVMILSIMMVVIGAILLVGVPMIESGKSRARMDVSMNSFLSMQNGIEEVVRGPIWIPDSDVTGPGPSREMQFELMGGMLSVLPYKQEFEVKDSKNITIHPSNITYAAGEERIIYENGAVIRKYEDGVAMMVSNPLISIYKTDDINITVSIHAISLNGTLSSSGGEGKAFVETRLLNYTPIIERSNSGQVDINLTSEYPEAWEAFFDTKLKNMGLLRHDTINTTGYYIRNGPMQLQVQIYGTSTGVNDIFLSVVESKLDINIR
ncbi:MAG: hypothetical protein J5U16_06470 [Candidatus Methanoperedens sp.]|nr:hypothetical protein [Candidatus Methanoperedens sp.]